MRTLVGRPARLEAHLAAQAAALAHDVVSHLDLLFQPSASALYVAAPRSGSPRLTRAAGSGRRPNRPWLTSGVSEKGRYHLPRISSQNSAVDPQGPSPSRQ